MAKLETQEYALGKSHLLLGRGGVGYIFMCPSPRPAP